MSYMNGLQHLEIPFAKIKKATDNFSKGNFITQGGFGRVYKGQLSWFGRTITIAVKRLDRRHGQGDTEFWKEITMLSSYKHTNLVSLLGFCEESDEKLLIYEYESNGSLDKYISCVDLKWMQRLQISLGAARGFNYLHHDVGLHHRVLHRDIKSSNILLNEKWEAKVSDFGLSKVGPSNVEVTFLATTACGTYGYVDPLYVDTGILTKESDIYSFGVVLFELLCGRLAYIEGYEDHRRFLGPLAKDHYEHNKLDEIIDPNLRKQMKLSSLNTFSSIAYQCLKGNRSERPTMGQVIEKLEHALELQNSIENVFFKASIKKAEIARVGIWGKKTGGAHNYWSFVLEKDHNLKKITIDHGDLIYSLMFTSECNGVLHTSNKAGGWNGGDIVSEVMFDVDEELIGINGTVGISTGTYAGYTIISSLSFITNKTTHGPFGQATGTNFSVPWDKGSFAGFHGLAGHFIDGIGVSLKASFEEIARVGNWGTKSSEDPQSHWSFHLERNHHLKKISIGHSDLIYSLMFTTECRGSLHTSRKVGVLATGNEVSEVIFDWDEEIVAINGTVGVSGGYTIISSLSFETNKKIHGPFGEATGTPFIVPWEKGSFAGFYGIAGYYMYGIGVYLNAAI